MRQASRPIAATAISSSTAAVATRSILRSARAPGMNASIIPTSTSWWCATTTVCVTPTRTANRMAESKTTFSNFTLDIDGDGIALVTRNAPGRTMNVIDAAATEELSSIVEELATDGAIKGVVITSGKDTFCAGADLTLLESL